MIIYINIYMQIDLIQIIFFSVQARPNWIHS